MAMAELKIKKWGNSLGIIIPSKIASREKLREGDTIKVSIGKERKAYGFGMFKGIPPFVREHDDREF